MNSSAQHSALDDVLCAFAAESDHGGATLTRYLKAFPKFAEDIIDLSRELQRTIVQDDSALSLADQARIEAAWQEFAGTPAAVPDPLAALSVADVRELATTLGVPRQVVAAFREHRVLVNSIPRRFLERLASLVQASGEQLKQALALPPTVAGARNYKADAPPEEGGPIAFERLLVDAGVPEDRRALLMSDSDE